MITEDQIPGILLNEIPEINTELAKLPKTDNIYKTMQCFVNFTKELAIKGNLTAVKDCFSLAEKMLMDGNNLVKRAVENVYVFSISTILYPAFPISEEINALFNGALRREYLRQISVGGI